MVRWIRPSMTNNSSGGMFDPQGAEAYPLGPVCGAQAIADCQRAAVRLLHVLRHRVFVHRSSDGWNRRNCRRDRPSQSSVAIRGARQTHRSVDFGEAAASQMMPGVGHLKFSPPKTVILTVTGARVVAESRVMCINGKSNKYRNWPPRLRRQSSFTCFIRPS